MMKIDVAKELLNNVLCHVENTGNGIELTWVGSKGVGKSEFTQQVLKDRGYTAITGNFDWNKYDKAYFDLRLGVHADVGDLMGFPYIKNDVLHYARVFWMPPADWKGTLVILVEELNRANKDIMQGIFQMLTDRKLHEHALPRSTTFIGLINPDNGNYMDVRELDPALIRRLCPFIKIDVDCEVFLKYAKGKINNNLLEFTKANPGFLSKEEKVEIPNTDFNPSGKIKVSNFMEMGLVAANMGYEIVAGIMGCEYALALNKFLCTKKTPLTGKDIMECFGAVEERLSNQTNDEINYTIQSVIEELDKVKLSKSNFLNFFLFFEYLFNHELDKLCANISRFSIERINKLKNIIHKETHKGKGNKEFCNRYGIIIHRLKDIEESQYKK